MKKRNSNWKLTLSLIMGFIGVILLIWNFLLFYGGPPGEKCYTLLECVIKSYSDLIEKLPLYLSVFVGYTTGFAFVIFIFLSPVGIFLAVRLLNSPRRKLAIFAIVLNSIDLIFALFIAWFLFGLARGM